MHASHDDTSSAPAPRVALLGAFPPQSQGVQDYCRELGLALARRCPVHAIGFRSMYPAWLFPGVKDPVDATKAPMSAPGLRLEHPLRWWHPLGWLWTALRARPEVFHAQWWSLPLFPVTALFAAVMRLRGIPVVITVHNVLPHEGGRLHVRAGGALCRLADRVIVHSAVNRDQIVGVYGLPASRVAQVPVGVCFADTPAPPRADALRALGLPPDRRYLLSFGIIRPYKGVLDLIAAWRAIADRHPDVDLLVAGKPWEDWAPYQAAIDAAGLTARAHLFLDYIPEARLPDFFRAADLVVLPYTHFDAQSAVPAVALPHRRPILVSRVGGLPDWVGGDPAWTVPPRDSGALAQRLDAFFADSAAQTAAFAPIADAAIARFSWTAIADRHRALYAEVLAQRRGRTPT